ncbi:MAG TPA: tetratricopeptide repeat protein [Flavobacteriales bacterium]|nr:tetratricopeptide repeat protein [Flavobacteriales bacterium]
MRSCSKPLTILALLVVLADHSRGAEAVRGMRTLPPFQDTALHGHLVRAVAFMDGFHGDSALLAINAGLASLDPRTQLEEQHYFLAYRAEVLYYEGLFNEAMHDLNEAERLALELRDSTLIANAYNLKGLLHENIQDSREALPYMHLALHWFPERPAARYPVSELYHIHGNLGSYLTTLGQLDSAEFHLQHSLQLATAAHAQRAVAVALWSLGNLHVLRGKPSIALEHYERSWAIADSAGDRDIGVDALVGKALAFALAGRERDARVALEHAKEYLTRYRPNIGLVTQRNFAKQAARAYEHIGDLSAALNERAQWHHIDSTITANNIRSALRTQALLLKTDNDLEVERLERARVADQLYHAQRTRWWVIIASLFAIAGISTIYLVNGARQRHKRRLAEIEAAHAQQERTIAELRIREQVSRDLHDDLGVGLSALKLRSEMSVLNDPGSTEAPLLREQATAAEELITSMRDIIWAMQDDQGSLDDLVAYISSHARNYLDAHGISLSLELDEAWPAIQLTTQQRRNIFLVIKEALHNVVKHANAEQVTLAMHWKNGLHAVVADDGNGLPSEPKKGGHGLVNMAKRAQQVGGEFTLEPAPNGRGTNLTLTVPFRVNES